MKRLSEMLASMVAQLFIRVDGEAYLNGFFPRIQQDSDFLDQPPVNERFGFVSVAACLEGVLHFFGECMGGQRDDGYSRGYWVRPDLPGRFPAI